MRAVQASEEARKSGSERFNLSVSIGGVPEYSVTNVHPSASASLILCSSSVIVFGWLPLTRARRVMRPFTTIQPTGFWAMRQTADITVANGLNCGGIQTVCQRVS